MSSLQEDPGNKRQRRCHSSDLVGDNNNNNNTGNVMGVENSGNNNSVSLLELGKDCLSHVAIFLHPRDLCRSEFVCKIFKNIATPLIEDLVIKMNKDCDGCVPNGEGRTRTKLIRYVAAMDMAKVVRAGLSSHLMKPVDGNPEKLEPECKGCNAFPQTTIANDIPLARRNISNEYFVYIFDNDDDEEPIKFQGFLPHRPGLRIAAFLTPSLLKTKWSKMKALLQNSFEIDDEDEIRQFQRTVHKDIFTPGLSMVILAVNKVNNVASLCCASQNYTNSRRCQNFNNSTSLSVYFESSVNSDVVHSSNQEEPGSGIWLEAQNNLLHMQVTYSRWW